MPYTPSEQAFWLARIAACTTVIGNPKEGGSVIPSIATVIKKATAAGENPPSYPLLKRWWENLPIEEQVRLHEIHATSYLFVDNEAAEDSLGNARNLAKAASPRIIEGAIAMALDVSNSIKDRIAAATLVFKVAGGLNEAPQVSVTVNAGEQEFLLRWEKLHGTPIIEETPIVQVEAAIPMLAERPPWETEVEPALSQDKTET
jgi:hypothetical protein